MPNDNVHDMPFGNEVMQRLVTKAIEKYVDSVTPPIDAEEKRLWDNIVLQAMSNAQMMQKDFEESMTFSIRLANNLITERRKFFSTNKPS
jgi:hypothetical protein